MNVYGAPVAEGKIVVLFAQGKNADIVGVVNDTFGRAKSETKGIAAQFKGATRLATALNIWQFLRNEIKYKADPVTSQMVRTPARLLRDKIGDCKSYTTFAGGILANLGAPVIYRYASYDKNDKRPSHVYCVTIDEFGREIIVDGVYAKFNKECPYYYKSDKKMNVGILTGIGARSLINGAPRVATFQAVLNSAWVKKHPVLQIILLNHIARINGQRLSSQTPNKLALSRYLARLRSMQKHFNSPAISQAIQGEINAVSSGSFTGILPKLATGAIPKTKKLAAVPQSDLEIGKIRLGKFLKRVGKDLSLKKVKQALATVALIPARKAFLALVAINARGLATRIRNAKNKGEILSKWAGFGGRKSVLESAVNKGAKKRPLFGRGKRIRGIGDLNYAVYNEGEGIGEPVTLTAILATATPILLAIIGLLKKGGAPEVSESGEVLPEGSAGGFDLVQEALGAGGGRVVENIKDFVQGHAPGALMTAAAPDYQPTEAEKQADTALQSDDSGNGLLLLGVGAFLFLALKK